MRSLIFDSGPVISLSLTGMLWLLKPLQERFQGDFYISESVRHELVTTPLRSRKFKLEAFQVEEQVRERVLKVVHDHHLMEHTGALMDIANRMYWSGGQPLSIVQIGEISSLALACHLRAEAVVVDERVTRELVENPEGVATVMSHRIGAPVTLDTKALAAWRRALCDMRIIRSIELVTVAYEHGLLDRYVPRLPFPGIKEPRREVLDAALWGIKLAGCAVSENEIERIIKMDAPIR